MKKLRDRTKLVLDTQTIRVLTPDRLASVVGGAATDTCVCMRKAGGDPK
jgi:hypothetical protein